MKYGSGVKEARFLERINRFVARVEIAGGEQIVHVKNTGRCKELLVPGSTVYLAESENPNRKTRYDLVAVEKLRKEKPPLLINMDSQIVNDAAEEWLRSGALFSERAVFRREIRYGNSRFDFYIEDGSRRAFLEVKGVTLESEGVASFPDAPTERGIKHLEELISCLSDGYEACVLFVVAMKGISCFRPSDATHRAFGDALRRAARAGVRILCMDCWITPDSISLQDPVPVLLER